MNYFSSIPISYFKIIGCFFEKLAEDINEGEEYEEDKYFKFTIKDENKNYLFEIEGKCLTLSINQDLLLELESNVEISIYSELDDHKLKEISELQNRTWINIDETRTGEEINEIWENKWSMTIEEIEKID